MTPNMAVLHDVIDLVRDSQWQKKTAASYDTVLNGLLKNLDLKTLKRAKDLEKFCPNYLKLAPHGQKEVWSELLQAMAFAESDNQVQEYYMDSNPSIGLLQISYADEKQHGCVFPNHLGDTIGKTRPQAILVLEALKAKITHLKKTNKVNLEEYIQGSIYDPIMNLRCGIKILSDQILGSGYNKQCSGYIFCNGSYWSVLRPNRASHSKLVAKWNELLAEGGVPACGAKPLK